MGYLRQTTWILTATAGLGFLGAAGANAQTTPDPYNPQMQRSQPATTTSGNSANITPSLIDMGFGTDQGNTGPFVTMSDKQFAQITASQALVELALAQAALKKSSNPEVKNVAQRMIDDYTKWGSGIRVAAVNLRIDLPATIDSKHSSEIDKISALSGTEFDQAYLKEVVHLQDKALTITQHEVESAGVTGFRHWAGVMVPKLQQEIEMARRAMTANPIVSKK